MTRARLTVVPRRAQRRAPRVPVRDPGRRLVLLGGRGRAAPLQHLDAAGALRGQQRSRQQARTLTAREQTLQMELDASATRSGSPRRRRRMGMVAARSARPSSSSPTARCVGVPTAGHPRQRPADPGPAARASRRCSTPTPIVHEEVADTAAATTRGRRLAAATMDGRKHRDRNRPLTARDVRRPNPSAPTPAAPSRARITDVPAAGRLRGHRDGALGLRGPAGAAAGRSTRSRTPRWRPPRAPSRWCCRPAAATSSTATATRSPTRSTG